MSLCDTALRLAQRQLFRPLWTAEILLEAERSVVRRGFPGDRIKRRFALIRKHFPECEVTGYEQFISTVSCEEKDRHVLAAAVFAGAELIVTSNTRDFPAKSTAPHRIKVVSPDDFLMNLAQLYPGIVLEVIQEQAMALKSPPMGVTEVLDALARAGAPKFAAQIRGLLRFTEKRRLSPLIVRINVTDKPNTPVLVEGRLLVWG